MSPWANKSEEPSLNAAGGRYSEGAGLCRGRQVSRDNGESPGTANGPSVQGEI